MLRKIEISGQRRKIDILKDEEFTRTNVFDLEVSKLHVVFLTVYENKNLRVNGLYFSDPIETKLNVLSVSREEYYRVVSYAFSFLSYSF